MLGNKLTELALFTSNASPRADVSSPKPDDRRTALAGLVMSFGSFHVLPYQRLLLKGDQPVRLGSRAFDILTVLVERAGEVVSKDELIARAWPHAFVEEANLKFQVSALRRALGDCQAGHRYVVTVPGRGYIFVAPMRREGEPCQVSPNVWWARSRREVVIQIIEPLTCRQPNRR
jgi:DNA-binding winged helix-turn-helix (wHTH) protein